MYTLPIAYALKYVNAISITFRIIKRFKVPAMNGASNENWMKLNECNEVDWRQLNDVWSEEKLMGQDSNEPKCETNVLNEFNESNWIKWMNVQSESNEWREHEGAWIDEIKKANWERSELTERSVECNVMS